MSRSLTFARNILHNSAGKSKGIQYDNIPGIDDDGVPVSLSIWVKRVEAQTADQNMVFVGQVAADADDGGVRLFLNGTSGNIQFDVQHVTNDAVHATSISPDVGEWMHIACSWQGTVGGAVPKLYINGEAKSGSTNAGAGARSDASGSHSLGGRQATVNRGFGGLLAGAGRWTEELTEGEVQQLYHGAHPLEIRPESLVLCPDFGTLENIAGRRTTTRPNLIEHDGNVYAGPSHLRYSKRIVGISRVTEDVKFSVIKKPWTKKPPEGTSIDWGNSLTKGLVNLWVIQTPNTTLQDLVGGVSLSPNGTVGFRPGEQGNGLVVSTRGANELAYWDSAGGGMDTAGQEYITLYSRYLINAHQASGGCPALHGISNTSVGVEIGIKDYSGQHRVVFDLTSYGQAQTNQAGLATGEWHDVTAIYDADVGVLHYLGGELIETISAAAGYSINSTPNTFKIGIGTPSDSARAFDGDVAIVGIWHRTLSAAENKSLADNPWQIFEPELIHVPFNEELPALATFDGPEVTSMPLKPPK